jgi:hypothetical protein
MPVSLPEQVLVVLVVLWRLLQVPQQVTAVELLL